MEKNDFLRWTVLTALVAVGCGDPQGTAYFPPEDGGDDAAVSDGDLDAQLPSFDIPPPPPPPPTDGGGVGMCPASCNTNMDCMPCYSPGEMGNYCCVSNLCIFMTGTCSATPPPPPPPGGDGGTPGPDGGTPGPDGGGPDGGTDGGGGLG